MESSTSAYAVPMGPNDQQLPATSPPWPQPDEVKIVVPDVSALDDLREIEADLQALLERVRRVIKRRGG